MDTILSHSLVHSTLHGVPYHVGGSDRVSELDIVAMKAFKLHKKRRRRVGLGNNVYRKFTTWLCEHE